MDTLQDKKTEILQATTRLIRDHGLQALSFEAVSTEANMSRQLVRYYFPDLDTLITELCDFLGNGYREMLIAGIVDVGEVERLDFFLDFFFDMAADHPMPDNLEVYDSLVAYTIGSDGLRQRLTGQYKTLGHVVSHELLVSYPELDGHACEEISFVFVAMMHANWSFVATLGYSYDHRKLIRDAMDRLIESYCRTPPREPVAKQPWSFED